MLVAELYKALPKGVREEKHIDTIIENPEPSAIKERRSAQHEVRQSFEEVAEEAEEFISDANCQYYFAPNQFVPKKQRPKWRFIVKKLYKSLLYLAAQKPYRKQASELIEKLYTLLCRSCHEVLFSSRDPFRAVGIKQPEFFRQVLALKNQYMDKRRFVREAISSMIENGVDRYTLYSGLMFVILDFLPIPDLRYMVISAAEKLRPALEKKLLAADGWLATAVAEEKLNNLTEMIFHCYAYLDEYEKAIQYFDKHYKDDDREVRLYILVSLLFYPHGKGELILEQIEKAQARGIQPRKGLLRLKEYTTSNNRLPEYMP